MSLTPPLSSSVAHKSEKATASLHFKGIAFAGHGKLPRHGSAVLTFHGVRFVAIAKKWRIGLIVAAFGKFKFKGGGVVTSRRPIQNHFLNEAGFASDSD
jgi:hypothetical protein